MLGTSRGPQDTEEIVDCLERLHVNILFVVGGDGSMRGAMKIAATIAERNRSGGRGRRAEDDRQRHPVHRPELRFPDRVRLRQRRDPGRLGGGHVDGQRHRAGQADGPALRLHRLLRRAGPLRRRRRADPGGPVRPGRARAGCWTTCCSGCEERGSAVVVVAEGAGQDLLESTDGRGTPPGTPGCRTSARSCASGSATTSRRPGWRPRSATSTPATRSAACRPTRTTRCTACGWPRPPCTRPCPGAPRWWSGRYRRRFVHIPMAAAVSRRNQVDPQGDLWLAVLQSTGQPVTSADGP